MKGVAYLAEPVRGRHPVFHADLFVGALEMFLHRVLAAPNNLRSFPVRLAFTYPLQYFLLARGQRSAILPFWFVHRKV